jgi:hypothetical protein
MAQVEAHARDHGGAHGRHVPKREHVLAHARRLDPESPDSPTV